MGNPGNGEQCGCSAAGRYTAGRAALAATAAHCADALGRLPGTVAAQADAIGNYVGRVGAGGLARILAVTLAAVAAGLLANHLWRRLVGAQVSVLRPARRLLLALSAAAVVLVVMVITMQIGIAADVAADAVVFGLSLVFLPLVVGQVLRVILPPTATDLRVVALDDRAACILYRNLIWIAAAAGFCISLLHVNALAPASVDLERAGFWMNAGIFLWLAILILRTREGRSNASPTARYRG